MDVQNSMKTEKIAKEMLLSGQTHVISKGSRIHVQMGLFWSSPTVQREQLDRKSLNYQQEMTLYYTQNHKNRRESRG